MDDSRIEELAQSKVEASQHFPIRITGMALFNAFLNSAGSGGDQYPTFAWPGRQSSGGGSFYQTTLGLEYSGPQAFLGGKVHGSVYMDFAGGSGTPLDLGFRLRTGEIQIDWTNRSLMAGLESPIFAPRQPTSLAQVEVPATGRRGQPVALAAAGALRAEDPPLGHTRVCARKSAWCRLPRCSYTNKAPTAPSQPGPGIEGRFEFYHGATDGRRIEIAPGFHTSITHVAGTSVSSNLFSLDWFTNPWQKLEFTRGILQRAKCRAGGRHYGLHRPSHGHRDSGA